MSSLTLHPGFTQPEALTLPEGWVAKKLACLTTNRQGGKLGLTKESHYVSNGVPAFSAAGCDGFVEEAEYKETEAVVLSAIGANCGRCFFASGNWTTLANVQAIIPNAEVDPKYLFYRVNQENFWERSGSAQPFIKPSSIGNSWVAFPQSKARQKKIATILTSIDTAIEKTEALIAKYQQIKAGLMHDLFTRGVLPNGQLRPSREQAPELYQETAIGWIPREWESINLGRYIEVNLYGPRFDASDYNEAGNVKTIRGTDFSKDGEIKYSQAPVARLSPQKIKHHVLKSGDVVVVTTADCGLTAVFEDQDFCYIPSAYAVKYRFSSSVNPYFIKYFMQTDMAKRQVNKYVRQGTLGNLPGSDLLRFPLGLPLPNEQTAIVLRLDSIKIKLATELKILDKLNQQKSGLMHDLLTGKVTVKVEEPEAVDG